MSRTRVTASAADLMVTKRSSLLIKAQGSAMACRAFPNVPAAAPRQSRLKRPEHDARREHFWKDPRLRLGRNVHQIERHGAAIPLGEFGSNARVAVGPIRSQRGDVACAEISFDLVRTKDEFFIRLAGRAPSRREIDIDRPILS